MDLGETNIYKPSENAFQVGKKILCYLRGSYENSQLRVKRVCAVKPPDHLQIKSNDPTFQTWK